MGITARNVGKTIGERRVRVLSEISIDIQRGEFVALTGRSGSGKSTLLYILSTLDRATEGSVEIDGVEVSAMNDRRLSKFRNQQLGFVFQFHYLLPELSALENVLIPAFKTGRARELKDRARELLIRFGLESMLERFPRELSGGEQQRLAIARALIMGPAYLFADEPTGSLDSENSARVMEIIREVSRTQGTTVLLVTHEPDYAAAADRCIHLVDGHLAD